MLRQPWHQDHSVCLVSPSGSPGSSRACWGCHDLQKSQPEDGSLPLASDYILHSRPCLMVPTVVTSNYYLFCHIYTLEGRPLCNPVSFLAGSKHTMMNLFDVTGVGEGCTFMSIPQAGWGFLWVRVSHHPQYGHRESDRMLAVCPDWGVPRKWDFQC